jgi:predicted RNA-binding protein with TRAM domain
MSADRGVLTVGDEREVVVGPVAHGGHFIAHSDGRTLFVRHTLPGELVRVRVTEVTSRIVRADAIEVLDPSPDRVPAPCPWAGAGLCGGCDFQHVSLDAQRRLKTQVLRESLQRFGGIAADDPVLSVEVVELPGAPDGLRWRTRMTWATALDGSRGLRRHRSHDVVAVDDCLIAEVDVSRPDAPPRGKVARSVRDRTWRIGDGDFWQVHPALPEALVQSVLEFGQPRPGQIWWDLYAGRGRRDLLRRPADGPPGSSRPAQRPPARRGGRCLAQRHPRSQTRWRCLGPAPGRRGCQDRRCDRSGRAPRRGLRGLRSGRAGSRYRALRRSRISAGGALCA